MTALAWLDRAPESPRHGTIVGAALTLAAQLGFITLDVSLGLAVELVVLRAAHALLAVLVLIVAVRCARLTILQAAFALLTLAYVPIFWVAEGEMSASGLLWSPFVGNKLVMIAIAFLVPGRLALGGALIAAFGAQAVLTWEHLDLARSPAAVAAAEPWVTTIYAGVAVVLLLFRERHHRLIAEYERTRVEAELLEELARVILVLRDTRNTPLQTLELAAALLQQGDVDPSRIVGPVQRAIAKLRATDRLLARYERWTVWSKRTEGMDADALLHQIEERLAAREAAQVQPSSSG